jgi:O-antigen/teichoic acid export membrane protein
MVLLSSVVVSVIARIKAAKAYRLAGNLPRLQGDALRFDREFRNYANWSWTQSIAGTLFTNLDRLLIGHLLGSVAAGAFFICIQIVSPLHMIFVAVFQQLLPRAAGLAVDYAQARDLSWVSKAVLGNLLLAVVLMLASLQVVPWFLSLWVGTAFASDNRNVIDILVIAYAILAGNVASYYVLMGLGRARLVTTAQLVAGVTLVAVLAIGTAYLDLGLEGAALARMAFSVVAIYLCVAAVREAKRGTKVCQ